MICFNEKKSKYSDNFRHRISTLKLQTAEDHSSLYQKMFSQSLLIYIFIMLRDHCDPPQPWTL